MLGIATAMPISHLVAHSRDVALYTLDRGTASPVAPVNQKLVNQLYRTWNVILAYNTPTTLRLAVSTGN